MGMSMVLYVAPDPDLRAFAVAPSTLKTWLSFPQSIPAVSLHEYWRDIDAILSRAPSIHAPGPLTPGSAEWTFTGAADRGAHALSSTSTQRLLQAAKEVGRAEVEAHVRERWAIQAAATGQSPDLTPAQLASRAEELVLYLDRVREICSKAVAKGHGLLMAFWEEL